MIGVESQINVDPTMLLDKKEWEKIIPEEPVYKGKYIFLYNLKGDKNILKIAKKVSNILKILYVFKKKYDVGPIEFLNLIKNAQIVLSSSFHGTIFSILLNKPFFAINGSKDFRINTLLKKMNLETRTIEIDNVDEKCKNVWDISFDNSINLLNEERRKSEQYLRNALEIK